MSESDSKMDKKKISKSFSNLRSRLGLIPKIGPRSEMIIINPGCDDEMEAWGYRRNLLTTILTTIIIIMTAGLMGLPLYWWEQYWLYCTHKQCTLVEATMLLIVDHYKGLHTTYYV